VGGNRSGQADERVIFNAELAAGSAARIEAPMRRVTTAICVTGCFFAAGLTVAPVALAEDAAQPAASQSLVNPPAKPKAQKPARQAATKKPPAAVDPLLGNPKTLGPQTASAPAVNLKNPAAKDDPFHIGGRWSASNDPNYGVYSTTNANDILLRNQGETTRVTPNKLELGVDYKF
jgi:hypothetical protein